MADVAHSGLTGTDVHEPKGTDTASANEVFVADGAASGEYKKVVAEDSVSSYDNSETANAADGTALVAQGDGSVLWEGAYRLQDGWRDLIMPFTASTAGGSKDPDFIKVSDDGSGSQGVFGYGFSATIEEELYLTFHVDHDYKIGSAFYPHVHWCPTSTNTGTVRWGIEWIAAVRNDTTGAGNTTFSGNTTITYIEQAASGTAYSHQVAQIADPGITITGAEPDMVILARVFRDATHANDTYNADAIGVFLDAHYQIDRYATPSNSPDFYT